MKQLYKITAKGASHSARDPKTRQFVSYGTREGERNEIELTEEGAKSLSHLGLVPVGEAKAYEVKGPKAPVADKAPAGEAKK
jgi:hypothetical protein